MSSTSPNTRDSRHFKKTSRFDQERKRLGVAIRELRELRKWSLYEAERQSGVDQKHWQKIEAGTLNPTLATLLRIADGFGEAVAKLFKNSVAVHNTPMDVRRKRRVEASPSRSPKKKPSFVRPAGAKPRARTT